ncbi:MAG: pyridoxamine 5'-phosphate oxidase family protein [Bacteroidia bacterium]|nr:pyridoxamine 5'-phosphate oxidase family protein [Bacteroidia bacterium]
MSATRDSPAHHWYTAALSTVANGRPQSRTVVLRMVDIQQLLLTCHTDIRAKKVSELENSPAVQWLFWDPVEKTQLRIDAKATIHHQNQLAEEEWARLSPLTKGNMSASLVPGSPVDSAEAGIAAYHRSKSISPEQDRTWFEHFAVIETRVQHLEWLWLSREGHRRASFECAGAELKMAWLVP